MFDKIEVSFSFIFYFPLFFKFNFCFMVDLEGERKKQSATEKVVENNGKSITG